MFTRKMLEKIDCVDKKYLLHDLQLEFLSVTHIRAALLSTHSTKNFEASTKYGLYHTLHSFHSILCQIISDFNFLHRWIFTITSGPFCVFLCSSHLFSISSFFFSIFHFECVYEIWFGVASSVLLSLLCKLIFQSDEKDVATT